ncbi:hypothetical protein B566_EDAN007242 [Ephemera danica]|nr:hypothetical protein B566_EDAN007242 [Ephemera danica]
MALCYTKGAGTWILSDIRASLHLRTGAHVSCQQDGVCAGFEKAAKSAIDYDTLLSQQDTHIQSLSGFGPDARKTLDKSKAPHYAYGATSKIVPVGNLRRRLRYAKLSYRHYIRLYVLMYFTKQGVEQSAKLLPSVPSRNKSGSEQSSTERVGPLAASRRFRTEFLQDLPTPGTGPYFDTTINNNLTALVGKTAYLNCRVKNLGNRTRCSRCQREHWITPSTEQSNSLVLPRGSMGKLDQGSNLPVMNMQTTIAISECEKNFVSWVRHRDIHLLTVGRYTYTSDQRFEAIHSPHTEDWSLRIRYPQRKDSGIYECQISTTPPIGHFVYLTVVELIQ